MKILTMCQGGNVRSVSLKFLLHYGMMGTPKGQGPDHDVISCGWESNTDETRKILYEWADRIIILQAEYAQYVPEQYHTKMMAFDVGVDRFGYAFNPELLQILWEMVQKEPEYFESNPKIRYGFDMHGVLSTHQWAREMAKALLEAGHEVHVVTAVDNEEQSRQWVASLGIPFTAVHCVHAINHADAGDKKAAIMKEKGIRLLLDDVPDVIAHVRHHGHVGLHVQ